MIIQLAILRTAYAHAPEPDFVRSQRNMDETKALSQSGGFARRTVTAINFKFILANATHDKVQATMQGRWLRRSFRRSAASCVRLGARQLPLRPARGGSLGRKRCRSASSPSLLAHRAGLDRLIAVDQLSGR